MPTRRGSLLLTAAAVLAAACGGDAPPPLPQARLVDVLTELHLAEARADLFQAPDARDSARTAARVAVLARYDLDTLAWNRALDALARAPDSLAAAYDSVLVRLASEPSLLPRQAPSAPFGQPADLPSRPAPFAPRP